MSDSLYMWKVKVNQVDLAKDLNRLEMGEDYMLLLFKFSELFPYESPVVKMLYPETRGGCVFAGGIIGNELLTQGWSPAYSMEAVIMQLLVDERARIKPNVTTTMQKRLASRIEKGAHVKMSLSAPLSKNALNDVVKEILVEKLNYIEDHTLLYWRLGSTVAVAFALVVLMWDFLFSFLLSR